VHHVQNNIVSSKVQVTIKAPLLAFSTIIKIQQVILASNSS